MCFIFQEATVMKYDNCEVKKTVSVKVNKMVSNSEEMLVGSSPGSGVDFWGGDRD